MTLVLDLWRRLKAAVKALDGMLRNGVSMCRSLELNGYVGSQGFGRSYGCYL